MRHHDIYFRLRFGIVNAVYTYLRLKIRDVWGGIFKNVILIRTNQIRHTKSKSDLFLYQKF